MRRDLLLLRAERLEVVGHGTHSDGKVSGDLTGCGRWFLHLDEGEDPLLAGGEDHRSTCVRFQRCQRPGC